MCLIPDLETRRHCYEMYHRYDSLWKGQVCEWPYQWKILGLSSPFFLGQNFRFFSLIHILRKSNHQMAMLNKKYLQPTTLWECKSFLMEICMNFRRKPFLWKTSVPPKTGDRVRMLFIYKSYAWKPFGQQVYSVCQSRAIILKTGINRRKTKVYLSPLVSGMLRHPSIVSWH